MEDEIWKPVPSKPGIIASSLGRFKYPDAEAEMPNGGVRKYETKPSFGSKRKASSGASHTYMGSYHKKYGNVKVHRLVCEAFHGPPPPGRSCVLHLDENAMNNRPENLKWGSQKENLNAPGFLAYCRGRIGENSPRAKWARKINNGGHND